MKDKYYVRIHEDFVKLRTKSKPFKKGFDDPVKRDCLTCPKEIIKIIS
ncbi:MAG: hypothetical protein N4A76_15975 [Firmicutes bacterium]|jgi:hypothetical protein|nr:hypothetical protein [Bacillota bacterium]